MPRRKDHWGKNCLYKNHAFSRATWIADRFRLSLDDVLFDLNVIDLQAEAHPTVLEGYMLRELPDCNVGCAICLHARNAEARKRKQPPKIVRSMTPAEFAHALADSNDPKIKATVDRILGIQAKAQPVSPAKPKPQSLEVACCSFCSRSHPYTGPMMQWRSPVLKRGWLYMCRSCAEIAMAVIEKQVEFDADEPPEPIKPKGVQPHEWKRIKKLRRKAIRPAKNEQKPPPRPKPSLPSLGPRPKDKEAQAEYFAKVQERYGKKRAPK